MEPLVFGWVSNGTTQLAANMTAQRMANDTLTAESLTADPSFGHLPPFAMGTHFYKH